MAKESRDHAHHHHRDRQARPGLPVRQLRREVRQQEVRLPGDLRRGPHLGTRPRCALHLRRHRQQRDGLRTGERPASPRKPRFCCQLRSFQLMATTYGPAVRISSSHMLLPCSAMCPVSQ